MAKKNPTSNPKRDSGNGKKIERSHQKGQVQKSSLPDFGHTPKPPKPKKDNK